MNSSQSHSQSHPQSEAEFDFAPFGFMNGNSPDSAPNIDIGKFLLSIWKPLILGGCLGGLAGIGVYLYLGPVYSANTQVLVSKKASVPINDREANRFGDRGDHVELIKSDMVIEPAFKKHGLNKVPELASAYDPYKNIREGMSVNRSSGQESSFDNVFDISFDHPDKAIAKTVVQAIVEAYRDYLHETRDQNSRQLYDTLLERQRELNAEVRALEAKYREFRINAPVFLKASPIVGANGVAMPPQSRYETELASIEAEQHENQIQQTGIEARLAEFQRRRERGDSRESLEFWVNYALTTGTNSGTGSSGGAGALSGPPVKASLDQQLLTVRLLEQRLLHTLGEEHSAVRNVRRQIDTILDSYTQQGLTPPTYQRSSQDVADGDGQKSLDLVSVYEDTLQGQLTELKLIAKNLDLIRLDVEKHAKDAELYQVEDQRLKDDIGLKKSQLVQIYDQIAAYDVSKEQEGYRFRQISEIRIERSLKRVIKIVGAFGFLGIGFVFSLAYFRAWIDTRIKSIQELCRVSKASLIGTIPRFTSSADADRLASANGMAPSLVYFHRPGSREAEAFRTIRTTLLHCLRNDHKLLQVSSAEPGDGKSTIVANTAISMAQAGKRILLVDCDLRRPTQHSLFGLNQEIGLTDVLLDEIEWRNAVRSTSVEGLSILTAGLCPENPAELLSKPRLGEILQQMRSDYDLIMLDSPPILAVSDPNILSKHVDGMTVIARMMKNKRAIVTRTMETLRVHGVKVFGLIANDVHAEAEAEAGYTYETYGKYFDDAASKSEKPFRRRETFARS